MVFLFCLFWHGFFQVLIFKDLSKIIMEMLSCIKVKLVSVYSCLKVSPHSSNQKNIKWKNQQKSKLGKQHLQINVVGTFIL